MCEFTVLNDSTHAAVAGVYEQLGGALESAAATPYISPGGQRSATTELGATPVAEQVAYTGDLSNAVPVSTTPGGVTPADTSASVAQDSSAASATSQQPASSSAATTPAAAYVADASMPDGTGGGAGSASSPGASTPAPSTPVPAMLGSGLDMGTAGVWRPGDIASVLGGVGAAASGIASVVQGVGTIVQGVGSAAGEFGDLFKDVVGAGGITGLIHEGVDAVAKVQLIGEHQAAAVIADDSSGGASPGTPGVDNPVGSGTDSHGSGSGADSHGSGAPGQQDMGTHVSDAGSQGNQAAQMAGQSVPGSSVQHIAADSTGYQPFNLGTSTTAGTATGATGGFFGAPSMAQSGSQESEHRPKIRYHPSTDSGEVDKESTESEPPNTAGDPTDPGAEPPNAVNDPSDSGAKLANVEGEPLP